MAKRDEFDCRAGKLLRSERLRAQISQEKLGKHLGVSFQQIQKYETGTNRISLHTAVRCATAFDVPVTQLIPDAPKPTLIENHVTARIVGAFERLEPNVQRAVLRLLQAMAREHPNVSRTKRSAR